MSSRYRAFLSYHHESDAELAAKLQSSLSRFAKPWYRLRSMRIFRDLTSLAANPALWGAIEDALGESDYFLLLACPLSAKSHWVQREVQWWLENRSADKLLLALTDGTILWNEQAQDFDWSETTAIPECLRKAFAAEPLYADFRAAKARHSYGSNDAAYRSALLDVAAPLSGKSKDDLDNEDLRLHRKAERLAGAVGFLVVILVLVAGFGITTARQRQKTASSRALASEATSHLSDQSDLALLLSLEARRTADTVESRRALLAALQRVSHVSAFLWGHTDAASHAIFSPDGQTILSVGWDNRVILWSPATHRIIGEPIPGPKSAASVAFSPDGSRFTCAGLGMIEFWDARTRQPAGEPLQYGDEQFVHVGFSPSGRLLAASTDAYGGHPSNVLVWDLSTRQLIAAPIEGRAFAFSPGERLLAIAQYQDIILYDLRTRRVLGKTMTGHSKTVTVLSFNGDGSVLASGAEDNTVILWSVRSHQQLGSLQGHRDRITSLMFDNAGLFSGGADGSIIHWDLDTLKPTDLPVTDLNGFISAILLGPDGRVSALACHKDHVLLLDVSSDPPLGHRVPAPDAGNSDLAFRADGRILASAGEFGDVVEWDVAKATPVGPHFSGHERQVISLAYSPDGRSLVSSSIDGSMIFWSTASHEPVGPPIKESRSPIWSLAWSSDGNIVASGGDTDLIFWDAVTARPLAPPMPSEHGRIWALSFSRDDKFLASAGNDRAVTLWNVGVPAHPVKQWTSPPAVDYMWLTPAGVSFSPTLQVIATTEQNSITFRNLKSGSLLAPVLYGHTKSVATVDFSRDGKILASGSDDGEIRLWDAESHEPIGRLISQEKEIKSVKFSPTDGVLASASEDGSITFWVVDDEVWSKRACNLVNRNLTKAEWSTYLGTRPYAKTCPNL